MLDWCIPDECYLKRLRKFEKRIPNTDYGTEHIKPFFGVLFEIGDLVYVTQVSHPKPRHNKLSENMDFKKIYDNKKKIYDNKKKIYDNKKLLCVVNLNYMFPIHRKYIKKLTYESIDSYVSFKSVSDKEKYIGLLRKEIALIRKRKIEESAFKLYNHRIEYPDSVVSKRCLDFLNLEKICIEITKELEAIR